MIRNHSTVRAFLFGDANVSFECIKCVPKNEMRSKAKNAFQPFGAQQCVFLVRFCGWNRYFICNRMSRCKFQVWVWRVGKKYIVCKLFAFFPEWKKDFTLCFAHVFLDRARGKLESWQGASLNPGKGANLNYIFNPFYFLEHLKKRLRFTYMYISLYIYIYP